MTAKDSDGRPTAQPGDDDLPAAFQPPAVTRWLGFPPFGAIAPIAVGAFASSMLLDVAARSTRAPCSGYTYPAFLLLVIGVAAGIASVTLALPDLTRLPRSSALFTFGVRQVVLSDLAIVSFGVSAWLRHGADTCADPAWLPMLLSALGSILVATVVIAGLRTLFRSTLNR